ncbi:MAG: vWA domain-containing protein, partial [Planctomycetota bacterium]
DELTEATRDASVAAPESDTINQSLSESVDLVGEIVNTANDAGSIDRITIEILSRLKKHKLLVVWLMDASASLRSRREQIIERFDRVYHELDELADIQDDVLLTTVVAFGEKSVPMIPEPTADREQIKKAVRNIQTDTSGVENVFGAVNWAAVEYHKLQTGGRKSLLIVLTDEIGDDLLRLDDAIKAVERYEMPVFVMGPAAPFGSAKINMKWTDKASGEVFYLPVDRGPESLVIEHAKLPSWSHDSKLDLLASGFGPYGLSRLVRASGGIYFLYDDDSIPGPKFNVQDMLHVMPDYVSQADYQRATIKSPVRSGVLRVAQATQTKIPDLPTRYLASGIQFEIKKNVKLLEQVVHFLNQAIDELKSAEKFRDKEASKRWQAHYDLLMGRMLATRIRCYRSVPLLQEMFAKPQVPKSHTANGWELAGTESETFANLAAPANPDGAKKKPAKKAPAQNADPTAADIPVAKEYLERVVHEHPNTPWALMAQSELDFPLGFNWQETFIEPPAGEKLPWDKVPWDKLTDKEKKFVKEYKAKKEKRQQRAKKREEIQKTLPPKL